MFKHYIWVTAPCDDYYKFIKKLQAINIYVLEIKYHKKQIYLKIEYQYFNKVTKYLISYKFKKIKEMGIYNIKAILKKYYIFLIAFIFGLVLFFILSNLIIKVNVIHDNKEIRDLITTELNDINIKPLRFKKSFKDLEKIKKNLLNKYPDKLDWLEIEVDGMVYNVLIEERIITNIEKNDNICDVIAKKDGTITKFKVFNGTSLIAINDYVKKGDILISSKTLLNEEEKRSVCASGEVYAYTWYTVNVSIPFKEEIRKKTGKKKYNIVFNKNGNKKKLLKNRFNSYDSSYKTLLSFFDYSFLLETEYETKKIIEEHDEEEALNIALKKANDNIYLKLSEFDTIVDQKVLKKTRNDSKMEVEVFIIVEELISMENKTF
ncbi:MAG: sporulation protein YqfD [Bacilli bacterium]